MILKFEPILKTVLWGGEKLIALKGLTTDLTRIGESWELSDVPGYESIVADGPHRGKTLHRLMQEMGADLTGHAFGSDGPDARFPLLIKFIDAHRDLSIQVHPGDELARRRHGSLGKTEMWYAIEGCDPEAHIRVGLTRRIDADEYRRLVAGRRLTAVLGDVPCRPGDLFHLPAGRIHAIGAGCLVAEVQQTSDITYRIYDYDRTDSDGRRRPLHTEESVEAIDFADVQADYRTPYTSHLGRRNEALRTPYFSTSVVPLGAEEVRLDYCTTDSFVIYVCTSGSLTIATRDARHGDATAPLRRGETVLLPATTDSVTLRPDAGGATLLEVTLPPTSSEATPLHPDAGRAGMPEDSLPPTSSEATPLHPDDSGAGMPEDSLPHASSEALPLRPDAGGTGMPEASRPTASSHH